MPTEADVVIGLQHGDEGKGKIVQWLIQTNKYDVCARFNGGPNAGHTIYRDGVKLATHGIPTGVVYGADALIGPGCVIDLPKLEKEIQYLEEHGVKDTRSRVKLSYNAHLITPEAIEEDKKADKVGTTLSGIGPTYARKALRTGMRIADLDDENEEEEQDDRVNGCEVVDPSDFLLNKQILFEGAQGFELDPDWGGYPYVTSSSCLASQVFTCGIPPSSLRAVYGVCKIYETYVGSKNFMPADDEDLQRLQVLGGEYGVTTGRARQCNWLNLDRLLKAVYINGVNTVVMNKCDVLEQLGVFKLYSNRCLIEFGSLVEMQMFIKQKFVEDSHCGDLRFSSSPYTL